MNNFLEKIAEVKSKNLYRNLADTDFIGDVFVKRNNKKIICFSSNDYFSLANNLFVKLVAIYVILRHGVSSRSSRYICGNNSLYKKLEKKISKITGFEDAITFSSGYQAALGIIPALVKEGDVVIADKLIHSCLIEGVKLSGAKLIRFNHNDIEHAKRIIYNNKDKKILIITEEIFSMDGDRGNIEDLRVLAMNYNAMILIDSAHSLYDNICNKISQNSNIVELKMGTFSKALGSFGGYVAGNFDVIEYLRNFSKSAIYTTALPPSTIASSYASLKILEKKNLYKKVLGNAKYFCDLLNIPFNNSAIVIIIIGDASRTLEIAAQIEKRGFLISAIRPPTVEQNKSRLRITFSSSHKKSQIKKLAKNIKYFL